MKPPFFEIVTTTTASFGTPHAAALQAANPGAGIHPNPLPDLAGTERKTAWRNSDRAVRTWWSTHSATVATGHVLFLEGDVYANCDLAALLDGPWTDADLVAANLKFQVAHRRAWPAFAELDRLPERMRADGCGIEPLAVLLMSRRGLDLICQPEFDEVFAADVFCELRLPTVLRHAGGRLAFCPRLGTVGTTPVTPRWGGRGIWHPVKSEVAE
jgi:hypothetical protein